MNLKNPPSPVKKTLTKFFTDIASNGIDGGTKCKRYYIIKADLFMLCK